jgi:hypothetical protein
MQIFTTNVTARDFPANADIHVDETRRELIRNGLYAFRNPEGEYFLARVTDVAAAREAGSGEFEVIGCVIEWRPTLH